jgi:NADPH:quinone reductase-like Zn-dependent oxidoreductase
VLVRIRASALNYRDLMTVLDPQSRGLPYPRIPNSDGAGEVLAVGAGVTRFQPGDSVAGTFFQRWEDGPITADAMASALGGALDGVLAEQVLLAERGLVRVPEHLTFDQAATLPCAGLTAWHALVGKGGLKAGETVLLIGTGGVSIFALQFAKAAGAQVIITSSDDAKLARARQLGADHGINYKTHPDWEREVLRLTAGRGVDVVIEVGGPGTLERSLASVRMGGRIAYIGVLTGLGAQANPVALIPKAASIHGIFVGSRAMFADMLDAMATHGIKPVIDREFAFAEAPAALAHMKSGGHFGKIVIRVGS